MARVVPEHYLRDPEVAAQTDLPVPAAPVVDTPFANAFRLLALNIRAIAEKSGELRTLLVTSGFAGDGRSLVAANLAIALAGDGSQVVVVEADRRRPSLGRLFELSHQGPWNGAHRQVSFLPTKVPRVSVAVNYAGTSPAVSLDESRPLLGVLRDMADFVIVDSPPCSISADPFYLASMVDGVVYVVRKRSQSTSTQTQIRDQFQRLGANMIGAVFNEG